MKLNMAFNIIALSITDMKDHMRNGNQGLSSDGKDLFIQVKNNEKKIYCNIHIPGKPQL